VILSVRPLSTSANTGAPGCTATSPKLICPADSRAYQHDAEVRPAGYARRASQPIHAEIIALYHAPSREKVDVEGAIESGGRGINKGRAGQWDGASGNRCPPGSYLGDGRRRDITASATSRRWTYPRDCTARTSRQCGACGAPRYFLSAFG
jgi:hypothetical protein